MSPTAGLFLSLALATAGFSALRLSLKGAWEEASFSKLRAPRYVCKLGAGVLLLLSAIAWVAQASSATVGWMSWLFCTLAIAPMPLIALWPFNPRFAVIMPTLSFGLLTATALIA